MYDSAGLMSILDRFRRPTQGRWVPFLDTVRLERRKDKDESYWPVGLSNNKFMCLILKVCSSSCRSGLSLTFSQRDDKSIQLSRGRSFKNFLSLCPCGRHRMRRRTLSKKGTKAAED